MRLSDDEFALVLILIAAALVSGGAAYEISVFYRRRGRAAASARLGET